VRAFLNGGAWELVGEFQEVETGKGSDATAKRPQLRAALEVCRKQGATLLIAIIDRLVRNVHFVSGPDGVAGLSSSPVTCRTQTT
jgi:DNA invertase Pin-like site-specific DNA recombinase